LIEMIVSLALFSVVITIAVGAFLVLIAANKQLQDEQAVLTNLSFALDSMTREIRTGSGFVCVSRSNTVGQDNIFRDRQDLDSMDSFAGIAFRDCAAGRVGDNFHGITFIEGGDSITDTASRIVYFHQVPDETLDRAGALYRRIGDGDAQKITSDGVDIVAADFFVTGARPLADGDQSQPTVTIYLEAQVAGATNPKTYPIQTTVVQRTLDL